VPSKERSAWMGGRSSQRNFVQQVVRFYGNGIAHPRVYRQAWQPVSAAKCEFNCVVSIQEVRPGHLGVTE
jgi:hypothetical protein